MLTLFGRHLDSWSRELIELDVSQEIGGDHYQRSVSTRKMERLVKNLRVFVSLWGGDRGSLISARIEEIKGIEGMDWISALHVPDIRTRV